MELKLNLDIPGWSDAAKLTKLANLAREVPKDGWIVEVGSFCGRSAYAMGHNKHASTKLTCFDKFPDAPEQIPDTCFGDKSGTYSYEIFLNNTRGIPNLETVRMYMPLNLEYLSFKKKIDLLFIDCIHTYEAVKSDIDTWSKFVKKDGIIVFDDYFDMFPGCVKAVDEFIEQVKPRKTEVLSCAMWVWL